jgi:hypothetical protein
VNSPGDFSRIFSAEIFSNFFGERVVAVTAVCGSGGWLAGRCRKQYWGSTSSKEDLRMISRQDRRDAFYPKPPPPKLSPYEVARNKLGERQDAEFGPDD